MTRCSRQERHKILQQTIESKPFLTDEELARQLSVSVQTIRLDRAALNIPELRQRTKLMAEQSGNKTKALETNEVVGDLIDLELGKSGISVLEITPDMVFERTRIARGHYVYSQANSLALSVIDAPQALTGVANVKYKVPVTIGEKLIAKAEVVKQRGNKFFVWVKIRNAEQEVFRAKFIMVTLEQKGEIDR